jgi:hypothetical protein
VVEDGPPEEDGGTEDGAVVGPPDEDGVVADGPVGPAAGAVVVEDAPVVVVVGFGDPTVTPHTVLA